jgi:hypothetical protein
MSGAALSTGNARAALKERGDDLYETPAVATEALLRSESLPNVIWEPACGPGSIVRSLRQSGRTVIATDLVDYGCPDSQHGVDFLMERKAPDGVEAIVTNPPFKLAGEFVALALDLCPRVVMLLRLAFLESDRRTPILDSGHLARVPVFKNRLPMMHRAGRGTKIAKTNSSALAFAWFVWDRHHRGPTTIQRISWHDSEYRPREDFAKSLDTCYEAIKARVAAGGKGWNPK